MSHRLLLVDDEPLNLDLLEQELSPHGYEIEKAANGPAALRRIAESAPDLVLLDYQMPGMNGIDVVKEIRRQGKDLPVIMITAYGSIERAVEAMKAGADDFVTKPFDPDHLALVIKKATERIQLRTGFEVLAEEIGGRYRLIAGSSPSMAHAVTQARKAAPSRSTVLLLGESGTGKEIFARSMHDWSERHSKPFVAINCAGLSRELLESELFGHEKGSFTGAYHLKRGKLELAHGGTVFLDEVGDISHELQTKLLRFLQEREFERVGGTQPIAVDVRIIAATNRDLEDAVRQGSFREDLYHRLNVIAIALPPLRERREDIAVLAEYFLRRFSFETKKHFTGISTDAQQRLLSYTWPGNVRELANVIERAVVLGDPPTLTIQQLPWRVSGLQSPEPTETQPYHAAINSYRRRLIVSALAQVGGNRAAAAKALGLHRTHLLKLMKALGVE
ncbi:MAG TPA: sigma-54 dependent transcriptional regulator [candidate division Zixibacteria bacterium]|nr:sigma-54 dependent transcriptional regulator [candidate division Zixibacteria bacterium]